MLCSCNCVQKELMISVAKCDFPITSRNLRKTDLCEMGQCIWKSDMAVLKENCILGVQVCETPSAFWSWVSDGWLQVHKVRFGDSWFCMWCVFVERMTPHTYLHTRMWINAISMNSFSSWTPAAFAFSFASVGESHHRMFFLKGLETHSESSVL